MDRSAWVRKRERQEESGDPFIQIAILVSPRDLQVDLVHPALLSGLRYTEPNTKLLSPTLK
jgi:hypothetical protein